MTQKPFDFNITASLTPTKKYLLLCTMFENKENRTELSTLGEFGLINHIAERIKIVNSENEKGIGDDAAVLDIGSYKTVVTTDMLIEGVHFDLSYVPLRHLGYKAIVVNVSDIYAMNAVPLSITIGIALSNRFSLEAVEELYDGMMLACKKYNVDIVGGDTVSSPGGLTISVTAIGKAKAEDLTYRNGAGENDLICVTGDLGAAYLGLQILNREKQIFLANPKMQPDFEGHDYLLERQLKPEARKEVIQQLKAVGIKPSAMIDVSDGLASELFHICKQSKCGCRIYEEKIPVDIHASLLAEEFNLSPITCALNGGEDYELLFTIKNSDYESVKKINDVSVIGHITRELSGLAMVDKGEGEIPLRAQGWDAFNH